MRRIRAKKPVDPSFAVDQIEELPGPHEKRTFVAVTGGDNKGIKGFLSGKTKLPPDVPEPQLEVVPDDPGIESFFVTKKQFKVIAFSGARWPYGPGGAATRLPSAAKLYDPKKHVPLAAEGAESGMLGKELAAYLEISIATMYAWRIQHEEFKTAIESNKAGADNRIEDSLFKRGIGYEYDKVEEDYVAGVRVGVKVTKMHVPPDVTAAMAWLQNRRPAEWGALTRKKLEITGKDGAPLAMGQDVPTMDISHFTDEQKDALKKLLLLAKEGISRAAKQIPDQQNSQNVNPQILDAV